MKFSTKTLLLGSVAASLAFTAAPVMAQDTSGDAEAEDTASSRNTITVTARRREESVLQVPVVASVLGGAELDQSAQEPRVIADHDS